APPAPAPASQSDRCRWPIPAHTPLHPEPSRRPQRSPAPPATVGRPHQRSRLPHTARGFRRHREWGAARRPAPRQTYDRSPRRSHRTTYGARNDPQEQIRIPHHAIEPGKFHRSARQTRPERRNSDRPTAMANLPAPRGTAADTTQAARSAGRLRPATVARSTPRATHQRTAEYRTFSNFRRPADDACLTSQLKRAPMLTKLFTRHNRLFSPHQTFLAPVRQALRLRAQPALRPDLRPSPGSAARCRKAAAGLAR